MQGSGRKPWPEAARGEAREDEREEGEGQDGEEGEPPPLRPRHFSLARRERTKESTASARAGGISLGFNIFKVLPVAR